MFLQEGDRQMNEQQLHYFLKIAEKQNLTLAAQELIVSPPALTATRPLYCTKKHTALSNSL